MIMKYTVSKNNIHIIDSYLISKNEFDNELKKIEDLYAGKTDVFKYTSDFSKGNFYFLEAPDKTHWWGFVRHYVYDALPYFFHETGE